MFVFLFTCKIISSLLFVQKKKHVWIVVAFFVSFLLWSSANQSRFFHWKSVSKHFTKEASKSVIFQNIITLKFLYLASYNGTIFNFLYQTIFYSILRNQNIKNRFMTHLILNILKFHSSVNLCASPN